MKAPPTSSRVVNSDSWSNMGTLFHSMLVASQENDIPFFNEYILPNQYSNLEGMNTEVSNRWGDKALSLIMAGNRVNEAFHNMFGCRTFGNTEAEKKLEKLGYDYMAHLEQFGGTNDTIYHRHTMAESINTVKRIAGTSSEEQEENLAYSQTLVYNWFTQFKSCEWPHNHMAVGMASSEHVNYLYELKTGEDRYLGGEEYPSKTSNYDFFVNNDNDKGRGMEINVWRVLPMKDQSDFVSQYFQDEMVNTKFVSYTPYWTTIDYIPESNKYNLKQDMKSIISDPNVFPITISKTHFLFVHRLLGFFCLRSLQHDKLGRDPVNFRAIAHELKVESQKNNYFVLSAYHDVSTSGLTPTPRSSSSRAARGKRIYHLPQKEYENFIQNKLLKNPYHINFECRNLARSGAAGSAGRKHYARRLKSFYGLCVGMASIEKVRPYLLPSGGHVIADSLISSFNKEQFSESSHHRYGSSSLHAGLWVASEPLSGTVGITLDKQVQFHGPLRSIYKAETKPMTWAEIVNETTEIKVPPPTHVSDFIPSWKDMRKPITVNVSGAPPIGFYHKERRCKVCNGRVILTTPPHCKVETVQCPHCREGKIEVNE